MKSFYDINIIFIFILSFTLHANEELPPLKITKIQKGVYLHKSYNNVKGFGLVSSNGLIVIDGGNAFIVDTPWSENDTAILIRWIKDNNYQLLGSISTHSHEDRTTGIKWLNQQEIPTYATTLTNNILKKVGRAPAKFSIEAPESSLADGMVSIYYPGEGHAVDNIVVWLPKLKILFGGCLVRSMTSKSLGYTGEANIHQWTHSIDNVMHKYNDATLVIPGHGKVGDFQLLEHTKVLAQNAVGK
jgi:metallo-beta-lactamase class B/metallo-beta-lactamase class B GIM